MTTPGLEVLGLRVPDLTFVVCPSCRAEVPGERLRCDSEPCDRPQVRVKCACGEAYRIEPFHPAKTALPYDAQRLLCPRCGQRNLPVGFEDWYRARASMLGFAGFELERIDWVVVGQDPFTDPDRRIPLPGGAEADYPRWTEAYVPIPWRQAEARTPSP